jgi:D-sedoheptulose 7-phosphate isomerase
MRKEFRYIKELVQRKPELIMTTSAMKEAFDLMEECFLNSGKVLICGNGGSAADSSHIAGELMKSFMKKRKLPLKISEFLSSVDTERGYSLASSLQGSLPALALSTDSSVISAVSNDMGGDLIFAQQIVGLGRPGDLLIAISTSGNAENVINAALISSAAGMKVIGLTGCTGGKLASFCDVLIAVPADTIPEVQELHLPVYHTLCAMVEDCFF